MRGRNCFTRNAREMSVWLASRNREAVRRERLGFSGESCKTADAFPTEKLTSGEKRRDRAQKTLELFKGGHQPKMESACGPKGRLRGEEAPSSGGEEGLPLPFGRRGGRPPNSQLEPEQYQTHNLRGGQETEKSGTHQKAGDRKRDKKG